MARKAATKKKVQRRAKAQIARVRREKSTGWPATSGTQNSDGCVPWLTVVGARQNNLKNITAEIPLGRFTCVTGVSGSGKSSLVNDIIRETLNRDLNGAVKVRPGDHDQIDGLEHLDKVAQTSWPAMGSRQARARPIAEAPYDHRLLVPLGRIRCDCSASWSRGHCPGR